MSMSSNPYLTVAPLPDRRVRILCFPHAGGAASAFAGARADAPADLDLLPVQLPGRERRVHEPPFTELSALVADLDRWLSPYLEEPHAFYGHSMGAVIAYHLALRRARRDAPLPSAVILGACRPPHLLPIPLLGNLSDDELVRMSLDIGGMSPALAQYPEWLSAALTLLRADLAVCASADSGERTPLPCPLEVIAGAADHLVSPAQMAEWADYGASSFRTHTLPGGHFFVRENQADFLDILACALNSARL
ncbi:thioesterase II family protein [Nocardia takedensis]|uniref:thioesterase II family protein n=1 Tax=Nocardia takedensis TaxID=259390 RepID=UPI00030F52BF|nr:alpha/beta fold hydrolase [Nocardia takedensis]